MKPHPAPPLRLLPALRTLLVILLAIVAPDGVRAQTVQGRVVDAATQQPVAGAGVLLMDAQGEAGAAFSEADGSYRVTAPAGGEYRLEVEAPGYQTLVSAALQLAGGQVLQMDARLEREQEAAPIPARPQAEAAAAVPPPTERGITGRVAEAGSRRAVGRATVTLLNARGQGVESVTADAEGVFHLTVPEPGRYQLRAERLGYQRSVSQPMTMVPSDRVRVELMVSTDAVVLAPLTVVASSRDVTRNSRLAGFEWRQENNPWGQFLGPEQIARIRPFSASDVLQQVPFVRISGSPPIRQANLRGRFGDRCLATVYVDGQVIPAPAGRFDSPDRSSPTLAPFSRSFPINNEAGPAASGVGLDELVSGTEILAVEVYEKPFEAPAQYGPSVTQINCGVILIWTRRPGTDNG